MPSSSAHFRRDPARVFGLALLILIIVLPMVWAIGYSLAYSLGGIGWLSDGWTLRHWRGALLGGDLTGSLFYSPLVAAASTTIATAGALALVVFIPLVRRSKFVPALLCIPLATPAAVLAVMTYQILNPGGFLARLAYYGGLIETPTQFPILVNDSWAIGIVLTQLCGLLPLLTLFFLKTWDTACADRYCLLAESLGATQNQARCRIALPLLLRRGRPLILLAFLWSLGSYEIPLLLGRQSPQMFSVLTQRRFGQFDLAERPQAFVLATTYLTLAGIGVQRLLAWRQPHG